MKGSYRLFGFTLSSDVALALPRVRVRGWPALSFSCTDTPPPSASFDESAPVFTGRLTRLFRTESGLVLRFTERGRGAPLADFYIWSRRIVCHRIHPSCGSMVEIWLLGMVLALWLEFRGLPVLHGSAVEVGNEAVAFVSSHHGGKSGLAAAFMQGGYALLTDDLLAVEKGVRLLRVRPGFPLMRMWPDEAGHFLGGCRGLDCVRPGIDKVRVPVGKGGFGRFGARARGLRCVYLARMRPGRARARTVEIGPVGKAEALIELLRHSFVASLAESLRLQPQRLTALAELVRRTPVRRLVYPRDFRVLPDVRAAVLADLDAIRPSNAAYSS